MARNSKKNKNSYCLAIKEEPSGLVESVQFKIFNKNTGKEVFSKEYEGEKKHISALTESVIKMMQNPSPDTKDAIGCLFYCPKSKRILLVHRADDETWAGVGGQIKEDEAPMDALIREIKEEINRDSLGDVKKKVCSYKNKDGSTYCNCLLVVADTFIPRLTDGENDNYKWCSIDNLPNPMHPKLMKAIPTYKQIIEGLKI